MDYLSQLTDTDFEDMAKDIEAISQKTESEIYEIIGNSLNREGYTVADYSAPDIENHVEYSGSESSGLGVIQPMMMSSSNNRLSTMKAFDFVSKPIQIKQEDAEEEGKLFWQRFKDKLKKEICNDEKIKKLITGNGTLKEYLITGIPIVMLALGLSAVSPVMLVIIASVFALIVKVGFEAYCEID